MNSAPVRTVWTAIARTTGSKAAGPASDRRMAGTIRLARVAILILSLPAILAGCLDWQAAYDEAARDDCRALPGASDRRACLDGVAENSREKRAARRGE